MAKEGGLTSCLDNSGSSLVQMEWRDTELRGWSRQSGLRVLQDSVSGIPYPLPLIEILTPEKGEGHAFLPSHISLWVIRALIFVRIIPNKYKWGPIIAIRKVFWDVPPSDLKFL